MNDASGAIAVETFMIHDLTPWTWLLVGLIAVFRLFQWTAAALGSDRGQAGLVVGGLVVAALIAVERLLFGERVRDAPWALGLGRPRAKGLVAAAGVTAMLVVFVPVFASVAGGSVSLSPGWIGMIPGLFAQAGIAEETLFRGYLFGHLRRGRSFWGAASVSMLPFVGVHLLLFVTMPWPIALAALLLAVVISFPLAHLFELGGNTIWAPAVLHFVVQGTVKVVVMSSVLTLPFALLWMVASAVFPMVAFLIPRTPQQEISRRPEIT
jgi:membrane protease YdiL (CAAX protease family)